MSTSEVLKRFFPKLMKTLPMDDPIFVAELFSRDLLPGNHYDEVKSLGTQANKAAHFLDHVIKPAVTIGADKSFNALLNIMEYSEYSNVKELSQQIKSALKERLDNTGNTSNTASSVANGEPPTKKSRLLSNTLVDAVARLQARYKNEAPHSQTDWPRHVVFKYVKLAIVEKAINTYQDDRMQKLTTEKWLEKFEKIKLNDLREIFHYSNEAIPRLILIMGEPGMGKTTIANEICKRWATEGFLSEDFDIVIKLLLRSIGQKLVEEGIIKQVGDEAYQQVKRSLGTKCLVVLDGLDEIDAKRQESDEWLMGLIKCELLERCSIVITSRPHACQELMKKANRTIEILGFGDEEIKEFVQHSFTNDTQSAETFLQELEEYPQFYGLCNVPVSLVMIVDMFKELKCLPSTLTELYKRFVVMRLARESEKSKEKKTLVLMASGEEVLLETLLGLRKDKIQMALSLCKLAFHGYFVATGNKKVYKRSNPIIIFTEQDVIDLRIEIAENFDGHGLLDVANLHDYAGDQTSYNFIHLTIQEFLCAVYMLTLSQEEQYDLLQQYFVDYPNIMILYCGLSKLDFHPFIYSQLKSRSAVMTAVKCLYEDQKGSVPEAISPFTLDLSHISLTPFDCICVGYIICHYPVTKLEMGICHIGDKGIKFLSRFCVKGLKATQLQQLYLMGNDITSEGMKDVMSIVTSSPSLRVLDVSGNIIGDDGISLYQNINTLTELNMSYCGLSVEGAACIKKMLTQNTTLKTLHIGGNNIGDVGVGHIAEALEDNNTLTVLNVYSCGLSAKGAISISELIKINQTLQFLNVSKNPIGDEGITAIAQSLHCANISKLDVMWCSITDSGAVALAAGLRKNHSIELLSVWRNVDMTIDGARVILEAAVANGVCQEVMIDYVHHSDDIVREMMTVLVERSRQEERNAKTKDGSIRDTIPKEDHHGNTKQISETTKDDDPQDVIRDDQEITHTEGQ